jgi:L-ribulokinase
MVYRALVEATAFGAKSIADRFSDYGIEIRKINAMGGIPQKSPFVMQILTDVMGMPIDVSAAEQATALGAAMFAAVAAGHFPTVEEAQKKLGQGFSRTYEPDAKKRSSYERMYKKYHQLGSNLEDLLRQLT